MRYISFYFLPKTIISWAILVDYETVPFQKQFGGIYKTICRFNAAKNTKLDFRADADENVNRSINRAHA